VHFDYTYIRLRPDPTPLPTPPFAPESELATKMTINIFESAYNYRWKGPNGPNMVGKSSAQPGTLLFEVKLPD